MSPTDTAGRARLWPPAARILSPLATLRGRIIAGFTLLVIIGALGAAGSAWQTRIHRSHLADMDTSADTVSLLQQAEGDAAYAAALLAGYVSTGDEGTIPAIRSNLATAAQKLSAAQAQPQLHSSEDHTALFGQFLTSVGMTSDLAEQVIALRQHGDTTGAAAAIAQAAPSLLATKQEFDKFVAEEAGELDHIRAQANRTGDVAFWFAVLGGTVAAIVAAAAAALIARSVLRPLSRLESAARAVAGGDLEARAPETGPRELVRVGASFNQMTESLLDLNRSLEEQVRERTAQFQTSEARYRSLTENTFDLVLETSMDGHFTFASPSYKNVLGFEPEDLLGTLIFDLVHPDDRPAVMEEFARAVGSGSPGRAVFRCRHRNGEWLWMEGTGKPFKSETGEIRAVIVSRDISARMRAEEKLRDSEEKFRTLAESAPLAIITSTSEGAIRSVNAAAESMFGYGQGELVGQSIDNLMPERFRRAHPGQCAGYFSEPLTRPMSHGLDVVGQRKDGTEFPASCALGCVQTKDGPLAISFIMDITERKRAEETMRHMAYHDPLTGLPNRALFEDRFAVALARARRAGESLCLMSADVDHFKLVNDTLGHAAGDAILKATAERLKDLVRAGDTVARIGGDEFVLLLPGGITAADAAKVAVKIRNAFRQPFHLQGQEVHATISIGISSYPQDGDTADTLIRSADAALYRAKEAGRSNYQLYTPSMNVGASERLALDRELRHALEREEFEVYYQPQVAIGSGQIVGAEALLRWRHPSRGVVPPDEFIPLAEETGLIVPLGAWVLRTVATQIQAWQSVAPPSLRVAVNISMRQFQQRGFVQTVTKILQDTRLDPACLELEITEGTAMRDAEFTISVLRQLRAMGVRISIDDFGTGHSSLRYLRDFPIQALKIDGSFVRDITTDPNDAALVAEVITLSHRLGLEVVAEGVETQDQLDFLRDGGCDQFQGYLCAKPMPVDVFEEFLRSGASPCRALPLPPLSKNGARSSTTIRAAAATNRRG